MKAYRKEQILNPRIANECTYEVFAIQYVDGELDYIIFGVPGESISAVELLTYDNIPHDWQFGVLQEGKSHMLTLTRPIFMWGFPEISSSGKYYIDLFEGDSYAKMIFDEQELKREGTFEQFDVVTLARRVPYMAFPAGTQGAVVRAHGAKGLYNVAFDSGRDMPHNEVLRIPGIFLQSQPERIREQSSLVSGAGEADSPCEAILVTCIQNIEQPELSQGTAYAVYAMRTRDTGVHYLVQSDDDCFVWTDARYFSVTPAQIPFGWQFHTRQCGDTLAGVFGYKAFFEFPERFGGIFSFLQSEANEEGKAGAPRHLKPGDTLSLLADIPHAYIPEGSYGHGHRAPGYRD